MKKKLLLLLLLAVGLSVWSNPPFGPPAPPPDPACDGNCGGTGEGDGSDGTEDGTGGTDDGTDGTDDSTDGTDDSNTGEGEGEGEGDGEDDTDGEDDSDGDDPVYCPRCGEQLNSLEETLPFGRMVDCKLIPNAQFSLYSKSPSARLFSPQGLVYDFRFESYMESHPTETVAFRSDGFRIPYGAAGGVARAGHYCSSISMKSESQKSARSTTVSNASWQAPAEITQTFKNGSSVVFTPYKTGSDFGYYRVSKIITSKGTELQASDKGIGIEVLRDGNQVLRQVLSAADGLADIVIVNQYKYEVRLYSHDAIGPKGSDGYYSILQGKTPYLIWTIENPQCNNNYDQIRITRTIGTDSHVHNWQYVENSNCWELVRGEGAEQIKETKSEQEDKNSKTVLSTRELFDASGNLVRRKTETHVEYDGGQLLMEKVTDPEGLNLKTSYDYYDANRLVKSVRYYNGRWESYSYDSSNRQTSKKTAFKNSVFGDSSCREITYTYDSHDSRDIVLATDGRPRTETILIGGVAIRKTFHCYFPSGNGEDTEITELASSPASAYGASGNLRTVKVYDTATSKLKYVEYPNGKRTSYQYEYGTYTPSATGLGSFTADAGGNDLRKTAVYGTVSHPAGVNGKSTVEVTIIDRRGNLVQKEGYALVGGSRKRISWNVYEYNVRHQLIRSVGMNNLEREQVWQCDALRTTKDETGVELLRTYTSLDQLATLTKKGANGEPDQVTTYTYSPSGKLLSETVSGGNLSRAVTKTYDAAGRLISKTDEAGLTTTWSYVMADDAHGKIVTETRPGGATKITEYYFDGRVKSITGTAQPAVYYDYGVTDQLSWSKVSYGAPTGALWTKTCYNFLGQLAREEASGFNGSVVVTQNSYDARGLLTKVSRTGQADVLKVYDELGNLIRQGLDVDGSGTLELASADRISDRDTEFITEDGNIYTCTTAKVYGKKNADTAKISSIVKSQLTGLASGVISRSISTDIHGNQTIQTLSVNRNGKSQELLTLYPNSTVAERQYLVNGLLRSQRSADNLTTTYSYDALGRITGITDPRTGLSSLAYYSAGNGKKGQLMSVTDAAGNTNVYDYDPATGRRASVRNAQNKFTYYDYNSFGQLVRTWGDAVYPIEQGYDDLGRRIVLKTYRGGTAWSNPVWPGDSQITDVTGWVYDAGSGLVVKKIDAALKETVYSYTADGKLASRKWARQTDGQPLLTTYQYDAATGELLHIDYSDATPDITQTYNRLGLLASVTDAAGMRTFQYNGNFNLTGEQITGLYNKSLTYSYASEGIKGRYLGLALDNTVNHAYSYDEYGRLNKIEVGEQSFAYTRLSNSRLIENLTRSNGVNTTWNYETNRDLITRIAHGSVSTLGYTNDALGRRTSMSRSGSVFATPDTIAYGYNDRSEVISAVSNVDAAYHYSYSFDPIGNRIAASLQGKAWSYTANALNQYTGLTVGNATETPTYDADGNMTLRNGWTQNWNGENRLVSMTRGDTRLEFAYDYMGRRVEKKVYYGESLTKHIRFVYDGYKLIEELDALDNNATLRRYTWQSESVGLDVPLAVYDAEKDAVYHYHTDANKNVTELTDSAGTVVAHYEYSPFGQLNKTEGVYAHENPFRFSSEYYDSETALVYYNYRYYDPQLGRWLSRDPIQELGGWNLYAMLKNNPASGIDKLGLHNCKPEDLRRQAEENRKRAEDAKKIADELRKHGVEGPLVDGLSKASDVASKTANRQEKLAIMGDPNSTPQEKAQAAMDLVQDEADNHGRRNDARDVEIVKKPIVGDITKTSNAINERDRFAKDLEKDMYNRR